jgi:hypothetical protein
MSLTYDLLDTFAEFETIVFTVEMRDRAGALLSPAGVTVTMVVSSDAARDVKVFEMTGSPQVVNTTGSVWQFKPSDANAALMTPGTIYYYDVWSIDGTNGRLHQVDGKIRLKPAAREA